LNPSNPSEFFHPTEASVTFATVILPLAVPKPYTYQVPEVLVPKIQFGLRVEVQFGKNKTYSGIVLEVHHRRPEHPTKPIISIIDDHPLVNENQLKLWRWMAEYYCCTLGEVMDAALPANLKLASERRLVLSPIFDLMDNAEELTDKEYLIAEALTIQDEITIEDVRKILAQKTVYPIVNRLIDKKVVFLYEDLKTKYKAKKVQLIQLKEPYKSRPELMEEAFEICKRSPRQIETLMAFVHLSRQNSFVKKSELYAKASIDNTVIKAMVKKNIFEVVEQEISRVGGYEDELTEAHELSEQQFVAIESIKKELETKNVVLLHGVTGSGKTRVYMELMKAAIARGEQVLYLLPEVALTAQIISRLQKIFGDEIAVYHHRVSNNERVDMWKEVLNGKPIILGARSGIFMPFQKLGLVIVDEEHDTSFKQNDPAPRYHGRDAAIYMAHLHGAKVILGTATPSIESFHNAKNKKYGLVEMVERFGGIEMPEIRIVDASEEMKKRMLQSHFTSVLLAELTAALERGEQAILFQNRRGYSPTLRCTACGWNSECKNCDVSLTYHKWRNNLQCHYCGYTSQVHKTCPACGSIELNLKGFGTEKIEDELKIYLPNAKIGRMDYDTVRSKNAAAKIINDFEEKRLDILVGTQMVTKGLDFENVGIVGVLSADQLLQFPDFRSSERGFHLITQVSGRAGRKHKRGKVIVQAFNVAHPVLREVLDNDYAAFFTREIMERHAFHYPPFTRLIKITLKHKMPKTLNEGTQIFTRVLKNKLGSRVIGPAIPYVSRVRNQYLLDILIKMERKADILNLAKETIWEAETELRQTKGLSGVRVNVDVDPV
jgi:primosomal protein N' (replication factor Y)